MQWFREALTVMNHSPEQADKNFSYISISPVLIDNFEREKRASKYRIDLFPPVDTG
jgi:hypothetical protein